MHYPCEQAWKLRGITLASVRHTGEVSHFLSVYAYILSYFFKQLKQQLFYLLLQFCSECRLLNVTSCTTSMVYSSVLDISKYMVAQTIKLCLLKTNSKYYEILYKTRLPSVISWWVCVTDNCLMFVAILRMTDPLICTVFFFLLNTERFRKQKENERYVSASWVTSSCLHIRDLDFMFWLYRLWMLLRDVVYCAYCSQHFSEIP